MLPAKAGAGTPMNESVLVSVATMVKQMAHHGIERPVRKVVARGLLKPREPRAERRDGDQIARR